MDNKGISAWRNSFHSLKKWYSLIKENLAMILLIPTLVGGIWQLFSLLSLGFEYVRFFSISQLVADGLLMMILIPFTALIPLIIYLVIKSISLEILDKKTKTPLSKQSRHLIVFFIILLIVDIFYWNYLPPRNDNYPNFFKEILAFLLIIPLLSICVTLGGKVINRTLAYLRLCDIKYKGRLKRFGLSILAFVYMISTFVYGIVCFLSGFFVLTAFLGIISSLESYFVSDNLLNIENVHEVMSNEYELEPEEYSIEYFNDTYIFIEHITVSEEEQKELKGKEENIPSEIIILKFDSLF